MTACGSRDQIQYISGHPSSLFQSTEGEELKSYLASMLSFMQVVPG